MRVQKETDFKGDGKYFLCEDFKVKAAVRMKIFRKMRSVKILRRSSVSILRTALYKIDANQTWVHLSHLTLGCSFRGLGECSCGVKQLKA